MKKRKVAYIRVSTAGSAQLHSYEFQEQYWRNKFAEEPETVRPKASQASWTNRPRHCFGNSGGNIG